CFCILRLSRPRSTLFPYTTLFRSEGFSGAEIEQAVVSAVYAAHAAGEPLAARHVLTEIHATRPLAVIMAERIAALRDWAAERTRSEEHTSELQSRENLVCRLLLEK